MRNLLHVFMVILLGLPFMAPRGACAADADAFSTLRLYLSAGAASGDDLFRTYWDPKPGLMVEAETPFYAGDAGLGLQYFHNSSLDATSYILGVDSNGDGHIAVSEAIKTIKLNRGFKISDICGSIDQQTCSPITSQISIIFDRPDPDAVMRRGNNDYWVYTEIHVQSRDGTERVIAITNFGQISVQDP